LEYSESVTDGSVVVVFVARRRSSPEIFCARSETVLSSCEFIESNVGHSRQGYRCGFEINDTEYLKYGFEGFIVEPLETRIKGVSIIV
jgi:hypothetical protein